MTNDQRERKRKKREKARLEHLERARREREKELVSKPLYDSRPIRMAVPDRNDRDGWEKVMTLNKDSVIAKAREMFKGEKLLWKWLQHDDLNKFDLLEISRMMTLAARALSCNPPFFVPRVDVRKKGLGDIFLLQTFRLRKAHFPEIGNAWGPDVDAESWDIKIGDKVHPFMMSTHAVDRLCQRLGSLKPDALVNLFVSIKPSPPAVVDGERLVALGSTLVPGVVMGHCPSDFVGDVLVGKSFLFPYMRGTPEYKELEKLGRQDLLHEEFGDLAKYLEFQEKADAALAMAEHPVGGTR